MANRLERQLSLWADFNSIDADHRITASLRFSESPERPNVGELIHLHDGEGNAVKGVVEKVDGMIVRVRPEMATWSYIPSVDSPFVGDSDFRPELRVEPARE